MSDFLKTKEVFRSLQKSLRGPAQKNPRVTPARIFRTRIWLESIFIDHQISRLEFEKLYYREGESSGLILKWLQGEHVINEGTAERLEPRLGHSNHMEVFSLPIFELLETTVRRVTINQIIDRLTVRSDAFGLKVWHFNNSKRFPVDYGPQIYARDYSEGLFQLGGIYGFIGLVALLREAELDGDSSKHFNLMKDVYRALPSFCRNRYFKKRWKDLLALLVSIQHNMHTTAMLLWPDANIIRQQIFAKHHPTQRSAWPRSPINGRFIEPEHPYVIAQLPHTSLTSRTNFSKTNKPKSKKRGKEKPPKKKLVRSNSTPISDKQNNLSALTKRHDQLHHYMHR